MRRSVGFCVPRRRRGPSSILRLSTAPLICALAALALAACGSSSSSSTSSGSSSSSAKSSGSGNLPSTVHVGVLTTLSDSVAGNGGAVCTDELNAVKLAAQTANKQNFFGTGHTVAVTSADDQGTPQGAVTGLQALSRAGVAGVEGPCLETSAAAVVARANALKTVEVISQPAPPQLVNYKYVFRGTTPQNNYAWKAIAALKKQGIKTVAIIRNSDQQDTINVYEHGWVPQLKKDGIKVVGDYLVPVGQQDINAVVAKVQALHPQAIGLDIFGTGEGTYLSQLRSAGMNQLAFGQQVMGYPFVTTLPAAKKGAGLLYASNYDVAVQVPTVKAFTAAYQAAFHLPPDAGAAESYDGAWRLFRAIKSAGSTSSSAVQGALAAQTTGTGVAGNLTYVLGGHEVSGGGYVIRQLAGNASVISVPGEAPLPPQ
jgi:branched-chain amino acid transport system substrate-binding protein